MRLYGAIEKVEAQDDDTVRVHGIATSEAVDEQGEIVRAAAIRAAIPDYMRFPALREMHQLSAAGTTLEAEVGDDGTTRIVAHVVDPVAVAKVKNQVYRGFSIGGRVTQRDAANPKVITGLVLNEISLVDRPANPEAVFDCWKAARDAARDPQALAAPVEEPFNSPIQIWTCGVPAHRHRAKAEALTCRERHIKSSAGDIEYGDPGYQPDGKKRYPIDSERHIRAAWDYINRPSNAGKYTEDQLKRIRAAIISAWRERIDKDGPPSAEGLGQASGTGMAKALADVGQLAQAMMALEWLKEALDLEAATSADDPTQLSRPMAMIAELCDFLNELAAKETSERSGPSASAGPGLLKAKHSRSDQALLDMASLACVKCLNIPGLSLGEAENLRNARAHLQKAGALAGTVSTGDPDGDDFGPQTLLGKRERAHQQMMDIAHECLSALTDGAVCGSAAKIGPRHSKETLEHFAAAHHCLVAAGAKCDAADAAGAETQAELMGKLSADDGNAETARLAKVVGEIVPMLERLAKRVDEIAQTPLPPLTIAKGALSVSKQQDRGSGGPDLSPEGLAAAFARLSKEEQTLTLIKASYANPIRIVRSAANEP